MIKYKKLFRTLGYKKSKKLVDYLMFKVMNYGMDFKNTDRIKIIDKLKEMKEPFKIVFKKDLI